MGLHEHPGLATHWTLAKQGGICHDRVSLRFSISSETYRSIQRAGTVLTFRPLVPLLCSPK